MGGKTYYFWAKRRKQVFEKDPSKYTGGHSGH